MLCSILVIAAFAAAKPTGYNPQPCHILTRESGIGQQNNNVSSAQVDLGYNVYQGYVNSSSDQNVFLGIRFAQPPLGKLRWQAPRAPTLNRSKIIQATEYESQCPQHDLPMEAVQGTEDCLFLNVWSPRNATGLLPVFVWIHGGGYDSGNGQFPVNTMISTNDNGFVGVSIQYRLGVFGFLASDEVFRKGTVNAGLLDQILALQWVQQYIHLFNGDPTKVTVGGQSAGAGSVMLQDMAYGGSLGTSLFYQSFAASPYLPMQYGYKDWIPSQAYYALAAEVGCDTMKFHGANTTMPTFECLLNANSEALINASATISQEGLFGVVFVPVTDGTLIQDLPSRQLGRKRINGVNALIGNNANEGPEFLQQNIRTEEDLVSWLRAAFPLFSNNDIAKVLYYYPSTNASVNPEDPLFATTGDSGPTALNQSTAATGQQQRADNIYAEMTFVCPSYWMAEAYSENAAGGQAYKYQFSVPPAVHSADELAYFFWPGTTPYTYDLAFAFQKILGNFIIGSNPSIDSAIAIGASLGNTTAGNILVANLTGSSSEGVSPASDWPSYSIRAPYQIDLNTTCGSERIPYEVWEVCAGPGTYNSFRLVNAYTWEGGRGVRCNFWRSVGEIVPE